MQGEQFLKYQPPARLQKRLLICWKVDVFQGEAHMAKALLLAKHIRQGVFKQAAPHSQSAGDAAFNHAGGKPLRLRIDRPDSPTCLCRFHERGGHLAAAKLPADPTEEEIFFPHFELFSGIRIVEKRDLHQAHAIGHGCFIEGKALTDQVLGWCAGYDRFHTAGFAERRACNGNRCAPILVGTRVKMKQGVDGIHAEPLEQLGAFFPHALEITDIRM